MGAILYLLVTGNEPPEATTTSAFANTIHAAKTASAQPIPDDIRVLIHKSLNIDPAVRFASIADMKQAISALVHGGKYSATTFNLAFYLSNLLKKEMEGEALDREKEGKVNVAAYAETAAVTPVAPAPIAMTSPLADAPPKKSKMGLIAAAAAVVLIAGGGAAYYMLKSKPAAPKAAAQKRAPAPMKAQVSAPALISSTPVQAASVAATGTLDPAAQKKAFEQAVAQKLQEEMMKLQADYTKTLKQQQSKNAPVQTASLGAPQTSAANADENGPSAAQLDSRRLAARQETTTTPSLQQQQAAPAVTQTVAETAPAPVVPTVHEGDVVDFTALDTPPQAMASIKPEYPRLAMQQKATATVVVSALISESGQVLEVKILKGDARFGFNDAALRAMRAARFSPAVKDGKHVRTWRPQTFVFSL